MRVDLSGLPVLDARARTPEAKMGATRTETDSFGPREVTKEKYDAVVESGVKQVQIDGLKENAKNCSTALKLLNTKHNNTSNKLNSIVLEKSS